jgi:hypothetical protein
MAAMTGSFLTPTLGQIHWEIATPAISLTTTVSFWIGRIAGLAKEHFSAGGRVTALTAKILLAQWFTRRVGVRRRLLL